MIDAFTYEGTNITDLLLDCAKIVEPKVRNEAFFRLMAERFGREVREREEESLMALLSGIAFGLSYKRKT